MLAFGYGVRMSQRLSRALIATTPLLLASCGTMTQTTVNDTTRSFTTVVVDAGHGGRDNGAVRPYGGAEKQATLDVATRLERKLRQAKLNTVMTRSSDVFVPLDDRASISNQQKNAIFVSIHFNDSRRRGIHGVETYYHSAVARDLAYNIQRELLTIPGSTNRGVKTANFRVLRKNVYPAVLVECGFLSNRTEGADARSADYRDELADKIAKAIVDERSGRAAYHGTQSEYDTAASSRNH
jgi:N-acetylmuramoyl-L-alanine amidase